MNFKNIGFKNCEIFNENDDKVPDQNFPGTNLERAQLQELPKLYHLMNLPTAAHDM